MVFFDLRDPGLFTLQLLLTTYFGDVDPGGPVVPLHVGDFAPSPDDGRTYLHTCSAVRAQVDGVPLGVTMHEDARGLDSLPRFGKERCTAGDVKGRWKDLHRVNNGACTPPMCSTTRDNSTLFTTDVVRDRSFGGGRCPEYVLCLVVTHPHAPTRTHTHPHPHAPKRTNTHKHAQTRTNTHKHTNMHTQELHVTIRVLSKSP